MADTPAVLKAGDVLQTIVATAKQPGVNVWRYLHDRVAGTCALPGLAGLIIRQRPAPAPTPADPAPALAA